MGQGHAVLCQHELLFNLETLTQLFNYNYINLHNVTINMQLLYEKLVNIYYNSRDMTLNELTASRIRLINAFI